MTTNRHLVYARDAVGIGLSFLGPGGGASGTPTLIDCPTGGSEPPCESHPTDATCQPPAHSLAGPSKEVP